MLQKTSPSHTILMYATTSAQTITQVTHYQKCKNEIPHSITAAHSKEKIVKGKMFKSETIVCGIQMTVRHSSQVEPEIAIKTKFNHQ